MRKAVFYISLVALGALYSCKADRICASYQSYFLVSAREQPSVFSFQAADSMKSQEIPELFALVSEDGLPRRDLPNTIKDENGLVKSEWAIIKNWNKRIVPMEVVITEPPDSVLFSGDDIMFAERDVIDSVALDSAMNAAGTVRYNNDQKFYNWYFREKLAWEGDPTVNEQAKADELKGENEKKVPFFKRIFRKNKQAEEQTQQVPANQAAGVEPKEETEKEPFFKRIFGKKSTAEEQTQQTPDNQATGDKPKEKTPFFKRIFKKKDKRVDNEASSDTGI